MISVPRVPTGGRLLRKVLTFFWCILASVVKFMSAIDRSKTHFAGGLAGPKEASFDGGCTLATPGEYDGLTFAATAM